jgi:phosphohistidine phosphatase SixA
MLASPYVRARETAEVTAEVLGFAKDRIETTDSLLPCEHPMDLLKELASRSEVDIMCFGHAPNVDDVIACALGFHDAVTSLKKAAAACIDVFQWSPPQGLLQWVCPPSALRNLGSDG